MCVWVGECVRNYAWDPKEFPAMPSGNFAILGLHDCVLVSLRTNNRKNKTVVYLAMQSGSQSVSVSFLTISGV